VGLAKGAVEATCLNQEGHEDDDSDGTFDVTDGFCARGVDPVRATVLDPAHRRYRVPGTRPRWTPTLDGGGRETGIDVLERRFAEGELSLEQYRERRSVLEQKR
jgi:hypothetical protein